MPLAVPTDGVRRFKRQPAIAALLAAKWTAYSRPMTVTRLADVWVCNREMARLYVDLLVAVGLAYGVPVGPHRWRYAVRLEVLEKLGPLPKDVCRSLSKSGGK